MIARTTARFSVPLLVLGTVSVCWACQYTVRDIGFIELTDREYRLLLLVSELEQVSSTPDVYRRSVLEASLGGWNVDFQILAKDEVSELPQSLGEQLQASKAPWSCWLTDNRGRCLLLEEGQSKQPTVQQIDSIVREYLDTPTLRQVRDRALQSFAMMIVGEASSGQAAVEPLIQESRQALAQVAHLLPRPVELPAEVLRIPPDSRGAEKVLLWSLQADQVPPSAPSLAIIYGRGKLAGPTMVGDEIQVDEILSQLALIGESCECETDRSWFQEPSIPLHWPDDLRDDAIHHLGFNPSSPLVKSEARKILSRGPNAGLTTSATNTSGDRIDQILSSYREGSLNTVPNGQSGQGNLRVESEQMTATVISGDGWGFEEVESDAAEPSQDSKQIAMLSIPPGSDTRTKLGSRYLTARLADESARVSGRENESQGNSYPRTFVLLGILTLAVIVPLIIFSLRTHPTKNMADKGADSRR